MISVSDYLDACAERTERAMEEYLARCDQAPAGLLEAIRYSLFAGGKRLRPALALGAAEAVGGDSAVALPAACAIEMIHTYSLIHDDLPCMDDDDLRRGKPTSHKAFDEATAVLAGDGLHAMAFDVAADTGDAAVVQEIAQAAGITGMAGGQFIDLQGEGKHLPLDAVQHLHRLKTGALIRVSVRTGAMLAGADDAALAALTDYGEHVGLAFQIADDILDVVGDDAEMGKHAGMDEARGKSTYPSLMGVEAAQGLADETAEAAVSALADFGESYDSLRGLARYVVERNK